MRVRTGIRSGQLAEARPAPQPIDNPGIGSEADQLARLDHAAERHGLGPILCPACIGEGCGSCAGWGLFWRPGDLRPCGPECPLQVLKTPA